MVRKGKQDKAKDIAQEALNRVKGMEDWLKANNLTVILDNMNFLISAVSASQRQIQQYGMQIQQYQQIEVVRNNEMRKWLVANDLDYEVFFKEVEDGVQLIINPPKEEPKAAPEPPSVPDPPEKGKKEKKEKKKDV